MTSEPVYEAAALGVKLITNVIAPPAGIVNGVAGPGGYLKGRTGYLEGRDRHVLRARVLQREVAQTQLTRLHQAEVDGSGGPLEPVHTGKTVNTGPTTTAAITIRADVVDVAVYAQGAGVERRRRGLAEAHQGVLHASGSHRERQRRPVRSRIRLRPTKK